MLKRKKSEKKKIKKILINIKIRVYYVNYFEIIENDCLLFFKF